MHPPMPKKEAPTGWKPRLAALKNIVPLLRMVWATSPLLALTSLLLRLLAYPAPSILIATVFSALLIVYRHRANINRLRTGREHVFSLKGGTAR